MNWWRQILGLVFLQLALGLPLVVSSTLRLLAAHARLLPLCCRYPLLQALVSRPDNVIDVSDLDPQLPRFVCPACVPSILCACVLMCEA